MTPATGSTFSFRSELWLYSGDAAWHFVTLPTDVADEIDDLTLDDKRGFGSVKVRATIGTTTWETSIFPSSAAESFVLPVKKQVRTAQALHEGSPVEVTLELITP